MNSMIIISSIWMMLMHSTIRQDSRLHFKLCNGVTCLWLKSIAMILISGIRRRTILFSGVSLHNFFFDRISCDVSILSYKCSLKQYLNSSHSLPNILYWYIYLITYLMGLTWFYGVPFILHGAPEMFTVVLMGMNYSIPCFQFIHCTIHWLLFLFMHVLLYFIVWMIQLFALVCVIPEFWSINLISNDSVVYSVAPSQYTYFL